MIQSFNKHPFRAPVCICVWGSQGCEGMLRDPNCGPERDLFFQPTPRSGDIYFLVHTYNLLRFGFKHQNSLISKSTSV